MEHFSWKGTIKLNIWNLKYCGLWPKSDEGYKRNFYTVWTAFVMCVFIFGHNFFEVANIFFNLDDLETVTSTIFVNLSKLLAAVKYYYVIRNMGMLKQLMVTLNSKIFQPKNKYQRKLVEPSLKIWTYFFTLHWLITAATILLWATFPILDKTVKEHRLPFMAWFPFNTKISPNYEMTYIYQIVGVFFIASSILATDALIATLNMCTGAQLDILCDDLRQIQALDFNKKLLSCIRHHKEIKKFQSNSNRFFNWIAFFQFFSSAISIGITLFQMTMAAPLSSEFFSLLAFEITVIVEVFMYCWFGNEIQEKSKNIAYAVFESEWINASVAAKKNMIIFVLNCQEPLKVSALNLFYLSLETYMKILQTAWSYFALLHQMTSRK